MVRKLARMVFWLALAQATTMAVGQLIATRLSEGDQNSDVLRLAAVCGARQFRSYAAELRSAKAVAAMGALDLDLAHAHLAAEGASLELQAGMGAIRVVVPADWSVRMETMTAAGGCQTRVTPAEDLPENAPRLSVRAVALMGGVLVTNQE